MKTHRFTFDTKSKMTPIRQIRETLEFTQEEMATRLGMKTQNYYRWESGKVSPSKDVMRIVKNLLILVQPLGLQAQDFPDDMF